MLSSPAAVEENLASIIKLRLGKDRGKAYQGVGAVAESSGGAVGEKWPTPPKKEISGPETPSRQRMRCEGKGGTERNVQVGVTQDRSGKKTKE